MATCTRTGVEGFFVATRGSIEDYHEPKIFMTEKSGKFIKEVLGMEPRAMALKHEAWIVSGLGIHSTMPSQFTGSLTLFISLIDNSTVPERSTTRKTFISECRKMVQEGLSTAHSDWGRLAR